MLSAYLDSTSELEAELVEDLEALVQGEGVSVFTEEVHQSVPLLLQLLPTAPHLTQRCSGALTHTHTLP